ncbi:MAG TPA: gluconokinase [Puia sp.]|nr:gluconokinase [Puia sp.]
MKYVIGVDIGTTNTKAVAFAVDGTMLGSASASYPVFTDVEGRHELDPDQLMEAVMSALNSLNQVVDFGKGEPEALSFSCAFHSLLAVDGRGKPLMKAMTWADLRPSAAAKALRGTEAGRRIYQHTGTPIHAMSPLCKLLWLRDHHPDIFQRASRFIGIKEYVWWWLTRKYQVDHSIASATGLFDIRRKEWYPESLALVGIDAGRLSEPVPCTHMEETKANFRHVIGGGDGCLANLGSGAVRPGETALTIGTSGAIRMTTFSPEDESEGKVFNYILSADRYACGGATNNGGNVLKWLFEKVLGVGDSEEEWQRKVRETDEVPPGCEGLIFLPYLQGERAPVWDADARGVFFGVRSVHDHRHFTRACLEGVSYSLYQIGASVTETTGPIERIYASGGFTRSDIWLQMIADIFNKEVALSGAADASAIGAAITGFQALGLIENLDAAKDLIHVVRTFEPDAARHALYLENYRVFAQLYGRLRDLML